MTDLTLPALWLLSLVIAYLAGRASKRTAEPKKHPPRRYEVVSNARQHEDWFTIRNISNVEMMKWCSLVVGGKSLTYRAVKDATGISVGRYTSMRKVLKRRYPEAFDENNELYPTPLLIDWCRQERDNCRTELHRTTKLAQ